MPEDVVDQYSGELTIEESLPLLSVLSKLGPIKPATGLFLGQIGILPHICWVVTTFDECNAFNPLSSILWGLSDKAEWFVSVDPPCMCLSAQPRDSNSGFPPGMVVPRDPSSLARKELVEFHDFVITLIPSVSALIERRLSLSKRPSLGLEMSKQDLALPGIEDHNGPSCKNVFLAADPQRFQPYTGDITSMYDRQLHYGLTDEDALKLGLALLVTENGPSQYTSLPKLRFEPYEDDVVLPNEIPVLKAECDHLKTRVSDPEMVVALDKLLSITRSAERYNLGILFVGD